MEHTAGPSGSLVTANGAAMTPRQLAKSPAFPVTLRSVHIDEAHLERDLDQLVSQYLARRSPIVASLFDQEVLGETRDEELQEAKDEVETAIIDGDWSAIEGYLARPGLLRPQTQRAFLYMCYREQFLEHIENRESQKAFNLLQKRLKPLEHYQPYPYDFYTLSYLTSASTVHDAPSLRDWGGVGVERERLVRMWRELLDGPRVGDWKSRPFVEQDRLQILMRQAMAWQVSRRHRSTNDGPDRIDDLDGPENRVWNVKTLLRDFQDRIVPSNWTRTVEGHSGSVKCVAILRDDGTLAVSGSNDTTLRIFNTITGETTRTLKGHTSRIWSCDVSPHSDIASASGDGSVRLWTAAAGHATQVLQGDGGDVYDVAWRPGHDHHLISASYDRIIRLWDVEKAQQIRTFSGHAQSTLAVAVGPAGKMVASGSKDRHVRLWDAVGGVCVHHTMAALGEITSLEFDRDGNYILAGCKDNSNRLWDTRMQRNLYRYTGHQNTSKNLIRCAFDSTGELILGGSEDGNVYIWEREAAAEVQHRQAVVPSNHQNTIDHGSLTTPSVDGTTQLVSPAQYPISPLPHHEPRPSKDVIAAGATVLPLHVLDGRGRGAVFDVDFASGVLVSAGEDGNTQVWREPNRPVADLP